MIYNIVLLSAGQQSESVIGVQYIHSFRLFSYIGFYRVLSRVPCSTCRFLLLIYFVYRSMSMSILVSQFIPPIQP